MKIKKDASPRRGSAKVEIAGIKISHPEKVLYPEQGVTKLQIAEYYEAVAPWILPHVAGRPISLMRCPEGFGKPCFFQRHISQGLSPHVKTIPIRINEKREYLMIEDLKGLIALAQMDILEIHIWGMHADRIDQPDRIVFDLDPAEKVPWKSVKDAAINIRDYLKAMKLVSFLQVTGGKGLHVVVPIKPGPDWDTVKEFTHKFAQQMARENPKLYTVSPRKADRVGRIFIDYLRNTKGASAIAPYSTRARAEASVAVPLGWDELKKIDSANSFTMDKTLQRLKKLKDPWEDMKKLRQPFPAKLLFGA